MIDSSDKILAGLIAESQGKEGPLLPLLHAVQDQFGYIPAKAVSLIASGLNISVAEVQGVICFYHEFRTSPTAVHVVQICRAEACQSMGSRELEAYAKNALGVDFGAITSDGQITLEPVYCLGNCACSPSVRIGDQIYARVDEKRFDQLISQLRTQGVKG